MTSRHLRAMSVLTLLIAALLLPPLARVSQAAPDQTATVTGTEYLSLRSCPALSCDRIATVPLNAAMQTTGAPIGGFVPVWWQGQSGWAYDLFLAQPGKQSFVRQGLPGCNRVALIFNAGIGEEPSQSILNTLVSTETPATLFAMGWWAGEYPDYLRAMRDAGIVIGSHGDTQTLLTDASDGRIAAEVHNSAAAIQTVTGTAPARYYTAYASDSDSRVRRLIAEQGYLPIGWTVSAADYHDDDTAEGVYDRVMSGVEDGAIVELHLDGAATAGSTAQALPRIIHDLRARGYHLVTVPDILLPCDFGP